MNLTKEIAFTKQETRVLEFILKNRGATTKDIILGTGITCPSARITTLRQKGVQIVSIGKEHHAGSQPFEKYAVVPLPVPQFDEQ